jgi:hypothetical protein
MGRSLAAWYFDQNDLLVKLARGLRFPKPLLASHRPPVLRLACDPEFLN